jgi:purine-binding chemotaxis protein CheW
MEESRMRVECESAALGNATQHHAGRYLTFKLDNEIYGVEILQVQEIVGMLPVTKVPRMSGAVRGVVNLRGIVIPVLDLRAKFSMARQDDTELTCIIVVRRQVHDRMITTGMIVDEVSEVVSITTDNLQDPPEFGSAQSSEMLLGMARLNDRVVMLLDLEKALSHQEPPCDETSIAN